VYERIVFKESKTSRWRQISI